LAELRFCIPPDTKQVILQYWDEHPFTQDSGVQWSVENGWGKWVVSTVEVSALSFLQGFDNVG